MAKHKAGPGLAKPGGPSIIILLAGVAGLIVAIAAAVSLLSPRESAAPGAGGVDRSASGALVARSPVIDLGRVPFDRQVDGVFELTNTGGTPVQLTAAPVVAMLEGC